MRSLSRNALAWCILLSLLTPNWAYACRERLAELSCHFSSCKVVGTDLGDIDIKFSLPKEGLATYFQQATFHLKDQVIPLPPTVVAEIGDIATQSLRATSSNCYGYGPTVRITLTGTKDTRTIVLTENGLDPAHNKAAIDP